MKNLKLALFSFFGAVSIFAVLFSPTRILAQGVNDFLINDFSADFKLTNEDPQGKLYVTEKIEVVFSGKNQGIERAIPLKYKNQSLKLKIVSTTRDGANEPFSLSESNGNQVVRIGVRGNFITGLHNYEIKYEVSNVVTFYGDYDEFYWDINGTDWLQTFKKVSVNLKTDAPISSKISPKCFTGSYESSSVNCTIQQNAGTVHAETTAPLTRRQNITIVQPFTKGYFSSPGWVETHMYVIYSIPFLVAAFLIVSYSYRKWAVLGKDYQKRGIVAPYFERPKNLSVMQASYVESNKLSPKHLSASMIDLAIRGYIKIIETNDKSKPDHQLELLSTDLKYLSTDEQELLKALFKGFSVGSTVTIEKLKNTLYTTTSVLKLQIDGAMTLKGYYELSPIQSGKILTTPLVVSVLILFGSFWAASFTKGLSILISTMSFLSVLLFFAIMNKRSQKGNLLLEHMKGLKLYLSFSEKDRIKSQDAVAAPLSPRSGEPIRDVKFFEKLLPFAVAMGVEKTWASAFKDIYSQPPDWYQGNWNNFTTAALVSSLSSTSSATVNSFSPPASSGSSGSSGGGFSGGGGGGGGGGGW